MIKFFRKIRKSLFMQNLPTEQAGKTGKPAFAAGRYFKYAIGEIVLVVIGILIALQINTWNQNRTKANKEANILANIHNEFKENKIQLETVLITHRKVHLSCSKIIKLFPIKSKPKPAVLDSLTVYLWDSYGGYTFDPSQTSINALISTSSFDIISDVTLRNLLISWNDLIKDYQEEERYSKNFTLNQYDGYISKHFDYNLNFNDDRNDFKALQSLEFEFMVKNKRDFVDQILYRSGELKRLQETLDTIIKLSESRNN